MIYKDFKGLKLSGLGLGNMRFPLLSDDQSDVDLEQAEKIIDKAFELGVNYFDTAWAYHGGRSESILGRSLSKYPRESFYISDKFPGFDVKNMARAREIFAEQLRRCGVERFDFYLLHNVSDNTLDGYMDEGSALIEYLLEEKAAGRIGHLGFSCHAELDGMRRFLDAHHNEMEFCQIQLNYLDWTYQHAREKVDMLREYGLPVWVMEPVRGGRLSRLPKAVVEEFNSIFPNDTLPSAAFRFLQSIPGVTMVLSGMSSVTQVEENAATWSNPRPMDAEEFEKIVDFGRRISKSGMVPCTGCRYCVAGCPQQLDIPALLTVYNELLFTNDVEAARTAIPEGRGPDMCVACHSCEKACPQELKVPGRLAELAEKLS